MSPRRKSIDSGSSGDESADFGKHHKDKKDKDKKEKKDKDKKDKDKDKDKTDKDKKEKGEKDKKDKDKDKKDKEKSSDKKDGKADDKHKGADVHTNPSFAQTPMDQGYGQFSSPPFVPPSFEANRGQGAPPPFPSPPTFHDNVQTATAPPSGYRVPLTSTSIFPDPGVAGQPPCYDADGSAPIFIGSALFENSVHPCKIGPHLTPFASVAYGGVEHPHHGRFDLLPFVPQTMEWVRTSHGRVPPGRRPIEGGYEENGAKLYHGLAIVNGIRVPGKAGEHLGACNVPFGGSEIALTDHEILCWR